MHSSVVVRRMLGENLQELVRRLINYFAIIFENANIEGLTRKADA